jgi:hypothetical protein
MNDWGQFVTNPPARFFTGDVVRKVLVIWRAHQDLNLRPIDYEDGGESLETLKRGRIVRSFLGADFRSAPVRIDTEPRLNLKPTRNGGV